MIQEAHKAPIKTGCPACGKHFGQAVGERHGKYDLFVCSACDLYYWLPLEMPDASWYEQMYGGRDKKLLPLEPGHRYFLGDPLAPKRGELLDIGCGTGNFLSAARETGYEVTGIELDREAAAFAKEKARLPRVLPLSVSSSFANIQARSSTSSAFLRFWSIKQSLRSLSKTSVPASGLRVS